MKDAHWSHMARLWRLVGPPLRPSAEDLAIFQGAIDRWREEHPAPPRALILGVTPELYALDWPAGTSIRALDGSPQMIKEVWPGPSESALLGSWTAIPLPDASCDIAVCDGGFGMLPYPHGQIALLAELRRILSPGGIFVVRLFAPKGRTGSVADIFGKLAAGLIPSLDSLKLQLWGALHGDATQGVRPRDVVAQILDAVGSFDHLARVYGWSLDHVRSLELHRQSSAAYYLTDAAELVRMACGEPGGFETPAVVEPAYELGSCCPVLALKRAV